MSDANAPDDFSTRLADMEIRLEAFWQDELEKAQKQLSEQRSRHSNLQHLVQSLIQSVGVALPPFGVVGLVDSGEDNSVLEDAVKAIRKQVDKAADFQRLLDHVNSNELLRAQWNRFLVSLRLTGGTNDDPA